MLCVHMSVICSRRYGNFMQLREKAIHHYEEESA